MSRRYEMDALIRGYEPEDREILKGLCMEEWEFEDAFETLPEQALDGRIELHMTGEGFLAGGESEEEFARRLSHNVWRGLGYYCEIEVRATYLEEIPYETHFQGPDEYEKWVESVQGQGQDPTRPAE